MLYHQPDSTCSGELLVVPSTDQFDSHVGQLLTHCSFVSSQTKSNRISKRQTDRGRFSDPRYDHHSVQRPVNSGGGEFGPVRVTDIELQPAPGSTQTRDNRFIYRRFNQTISRATTTTRIDTGTGQRVQSPILWSNRTWHWSTNRTREYDPDLDGTTLPPPVDYFNLTPPPLREPYETRFYPWGSKTKTNEKNGETRSPFFEDCVEKHTYTNHNFFVNGLPLVLFYTVNNFLHFHSTNHLPTRNCF